MLILDNGVSLNSIEFKHDTPQHMISEISNPYQYIYMF